MSEPSAATAYQRIRQAIVEGAYRPGERLVEQRIAADLELSRTPIREALRMLHSEGLVRIEPNRGAAVRGLTKDGIADLYELRARLESYAAELAATRATEDQRSRLQDAATRFEAAATAATRGGIEDVRAVFRLNDEFHLTILEAAGHEQLITTLVATVDHPLVFQAFRQYDPHAMARSAEFHGLICETVCAGDGPRAARLMHEHVLQGRDVLIYAVERLLSVDALFEPGDQPARMSTIRS